MLVNTSFNTRGEPIVCTPRDAVECFWTSPLDALVIGSYLLEKPLAAPRSDGYFSEKSERGPLVSEAGIASRVMNKGDDLRQSYWRGTQRLVESRGSR